MPRHANIRTTSRYLATSAAGLTAAAKCLEAHRAQLAQESHEQCDQIPTADGPVSPEVVERLGVKEVSLTVIEPVSITLEMPSTGEETDWQIGRRKLCPGLCHNACLRSTNTVTYGEIRRETSRGSSR